MHGIVSGSVLVFTGCRENKMKLKGMVQGHSSSSLTKSIRHEVDIGTTFLSLGLWLGRSKRFNVFVVIGVDSTEIAFC